jgi:nucleotide-binding universal stress UspA family protein
MHVMIATDGSEAAVEAARRADLFAPERVTLLTVLTHVPGEALNAIDEPTQSVDELNRQWEIEIREANRELTRTSAVISAAHVETCIDAGAVAAAIGRVAREVDADLIVMAGHVRHGLHHVLHRSLVGRVVRAAPCEVVVVFGEAVIGGTSCPTAAHT